MQLVKAWAGFRRNSEGFERVSTALHPRAARIRALHLAPRKPHDPRSAAHLYTTSVHAGGLLPATESDVLESRGWRPSEGFAVNTEARSHGAIGCHPSSEVWNEIVDFLIFKRIFTGIRALMSSLDRGRDGPQWNGLEPSSPGRSSRSGWNSRRSGAPAVRRPALRHRAHAAPRKAARGPDRIPAGRARITVFYSRDSETNMDLCFSLCAVLSRPSESPKDHRQEPRPEAGVPLQEVGGEGSPRQTERLLQEARRGGDIEAALARRCGASRGLASRRRHRRVRGRARCVLPAPEALPDDARARRSCIVQHLAPQPREPAARAPPARRGCRSRR